MRASRSTVLVLAGVLCSSAPSLARASETEPPSSTSLPRYDDAPPVSPSKPSEPSELVIEPQPVKPALREVPANGHGMLAMGSLFAAGGVTALVSGLVFARDGNTEPHVFGPLIGIGVLAPSAAGLLLGFGVSRRHAYTKWKLGQSEPIPQQGTGLVGSGAALLAAGTMGSIIGGFLWDAETFSFIFPLEPNSSVPAFLGLGIGAISVGSTLLAVGVHRNRRFNTWRRETSLARLNIVPILVPRRGGLQLGLSGEF